MSKRKTIFLLVVCFSIAVFAVQTLSQTPMPRRTPNMTDAEWKKEIEKWRAQRKLEREQKRKESKKRIAEHMRQWELGREQRKLDREKRRKERQRKKEEAGGFIFEKSALGATEEQWKLIKAKLEKVRHLREQATSAVGVFLAGGSNDKPAFQWKRPWKDKAPSELTEAQKLAKELIALVERKNTSPETYRRKMAALRKARSKEAKLEQQLAEAQKELREILTTRQEAALVLMGWL